MLFLTATNVEHPLCPPRPNFVRGLNYPCGCFCIPLPGEPDRTQLLSFFQTDLGGYLPQTVVDSFFPASIAGFYSNLTKAVKQLKAWQDQLLTSPAEGREKPGSLRVEIGSWPTGLYISKDIRKSERGTMNFKTSVFYLSMQSNVFFSNTISFIFIEKYHTRGWKSPRGSTGGCLQGDNAHIGSVLGHTLSVSVRRSIAKIHLARQH